MLIGVTIKLIHEQLVGANKQVSELIEANVAIDAHLWGAIGGLIFVLLSWLTCHLMKK
jgi:membrane associated rhomboid family serine protease